jgi:branched-chain amino acid transport system ATP-binding protein
VILDGSDITARAPARRARLGLSRTFQNVRLFANLTAAQNVQAAALGVGMKPRAARAKAAALLERFGLADRAHRVAASLPYGEERRLGLARALAVEPSYLLLDEPAAGLDEREGDELAESLRSLPERDGCGVLLIEHDMRIVMQLCHRIQVIDHGQTISVGAPEHVRSDPAVLEAYLGTGHQVKPRA